MNFSHWIILAAGVIGISLVVFCPSWFYPAHPLIPQEKAIGYRPITKPPEPIPVIVERDGRKYLYEGQRIEARIDYRGLSLQVGLIIVAVICGLLMLRANKRHNNSGRIYEEGPGGEYVEGTPNKGMHRSARSEHRMKRQRSTRAR